MIRNNASYSSILRWISYFSPRRVVAFSALNNHFRNYAARDSLRHEVGNEKSWMVINSCCSRNTCCCGPGRGAAAEESPADRLFVAGSPSGFSSRTEAFRQGLRQLGYVEGKTITMEYRYAEGLANPLPDLVADLVRLYVDVIVASSTPGALAARNGTK